MELGGQGSHTCGWTEREGGVGSYLPDMISGHAAGGWGENINI